MHDLERDGTDTFAFLSRVWYHYPSNANQKGDQMKNMFDKTQTEIMKTRIEKLQSNAAPQWGKFNVHQMICHLQDQMSYALGQKEEDTELAKGPPMFLRNVIRLYLPMPKGKIQTLPAMLTTQPREWENDIEQVIRLIDDFPGNREKDVWPFHPFFGPLTGLDWARLTWRHNNHHLSQFGV